MLAVYISATDAHRYCRVASAGLQSTSVGQQSFGTDLEILAIRAEVLIHARSGVGHPARQ